MDENSTLLKVFEELYNNGKAIDGSLLSIAPATTSFRELLELARDRESWREHVKRQAVSLTPDQRSTRSGSRVGERRSGLRRSKRQAEIGAANGYVGQNKID